MDILRTLHTILKSFDTYVITATTSTSVTFSVTGIGVIVLPKWNGVACGLTINNKTVYEVIMQHWNIHKNFLMRAQRTIKFLDK